MKKILLSFVILAFMLLTFACNKHSESENPAPQTAKTGSSLGAIANTFLRNFYKGNTYTVGTQVETSEDGQNYLVSEIVLTSGGARGYLVTNEVDGNPVYFADVDRTNLVLTAVDVVANNTKVINNIDQNPEYAKSGEFDFIKITQDMPQVQGRRRFFGYVTTCGQCLGGTKSCTKQFYFFWMPINGVQPADDQEC